MAEHFAGTWVQSNQENFEEYMKEVGVGLITRKAAANLKVTVVITVNGNTITWRQESTLKNHDLTFTLGQEFAEDTPDGRKFKSTINLEGGKLVQQQKKIKDSDKESVITRWVDGNDLHVEMVSGSVKASRTYTKQ